MAFDGFGLFLTTDPIPGGNANAYIYPNDPLTQYDLSGQICWSCAAHHVASAAKTAYHAAVNNRGLLATVGAGVICVSGVFTVACGAATAGALAVRAQQNGYRNVRANAQDAALTALTYGFGGLGEGAAEANSLHGLSRFVAVGSTTLPGVVNDYGGYFANKPRHP